jgi:hypothetical protein
LAFCASGGAGAPMGWCPSINGSAALAGRRHASDTWRPNARRQNEMTGRVEPAGRRSFRTLALWQPSPPMGTATLPSCNLRFKRSNVAGLPPCCACCYFATARSIIAHAQFFISHRSKAQAQYPCLTSCLPDVRPCKRKPPADIPSRLGAFISGNVPPIGREMRSSPIKPIGDERCSLPPVQGAKATGPGTATAEPEASAQPNSGRWRSCSPSCRHHRTTRLRPQRRTPGFAAAIGC